MEKRGMITPLPKWMESELAAPKGEGEGRNNQMIRLAPRLLELNWTEEAIFERFKTAYGLESDSSKDAEIRRVIRNARKYACGGSRREPGPTKAELEEAEIARRVARRSLNQAIMRNPWTEEEVRGLGWCDLPPIEQRQRFLRAMFKAEDIIWCGDKHNSGRPRHVWNFKTAEEWASCRGGFPFVSHCTFREGSFSRCNENVAERRYLVLESDELKHGEILSLFSSIENERGLPLRAAVFSGRRSIHGWFEWPENEMLELSAIVDGWNCDPSTLRASQPVRLPGVERLDTGRLQELLYLKE